jgi:CheY-like chemotaxis protein
VQVDPAGMTVLVVEDYDNARKALCLLLASYGVTPLSAAGGEEALRVALERNPDAIVCDIRMPGIDGFELLKRLRANPKTQGIPVVAMSGMGSDVDPDKIRSSGFADHLMKPVMPDAIAAWLHRVWSERRNR